MWRDLRNAVRTLAGTPTLTLAATVAVALAVGANGAIFGLVDALWFRPPGVRDPGTLVRVFATAPDDDEAPWSWREYNEIAARSGAFESVAVRGRRGAILIAADGSQELLLVNVVSTNFFDALGVRPAAGRLFHHGDDAALEADPGVVLGHAFWQSSFGADPGIVGRTVRLGRGDASDVRVLGVLPASFRDLDAAADRDLWLPPQAWTRLAGRIEFEKRDSRWFEMIARRRPDVTVAAAGERVAAVAASFARDYPALGAGRGARVVSDLEHRVERGGSAGLALLGLVLIVVLITCVNLLNLLLARASSRASELAVRVALGAGRWRLMRQLALEGAVLGATGAVAGLLIAAWLIWLMPAFTMPPPGMRSSTLFQTDGRVVLFTGGVAFVMTMLISLTLAWVASRADVVSIIKGSAVASGTGGALTRALVIAQVAVSLVLLSAAADLGRSFIDAQRADVGFARRPVLTLWTTFANVKSATGAEAVRRLGALPGVEAVAVSIRAPLSLSGGGLAQPVAIPGAAHDQKEGVPRVKFNAVSANYFAVLGTRIVRGRTFSREEERGGEAAVIVSEQFAARYFPGRDPIGAVVRIGGPAGALHRIIGVAQDGVVNEVGEPPQPYMYLPFWRGDYGETTFFLSSGDAAASLAAQARAALRQVDPDLEPRRMVTTAQYLEFATSMHRTTAALAGALGLVGLALTSIGVYGLVAYRTTRRTREIGIRMALGAAEGQVLRLVLRDGLSVGLAGIAAGLPLALAATQLLSSSLVGMTAPDLSAFLTATGVLMLSIWLATLVPAARATRVAPSVALRE